jgi:hypothetical protein
MLIRAIGRAGIYLSMVTCIAAAQTPSNSRTPLPDAPSAVQQHAVSGKSQPVVAVPPSATTQTPAERPYRPLTPRQKFDHFLRYTYSPYTVASALYDATYAQATGDPAGYGGGMEGWGKRFGASMASTEARSFFGTFLFPTVLRQDPRYFPMYRGSMVRRGMHALSRLIATRADDGHTTFNSSGMLAIAFNESLKNAYMPERQRGLDITFSRMLGALQSDATGYVLREFTPDLMRMVRRHSPQRLRKIEEKIPTQVISGAPPGEE